ncbi:hypothetical protein [Roseateles terrae]|uniref:DNA-binding transcriptional MerR regulator n=1 Tax=Roseateles terrae TaxID=431060 RepID=A0ABR6GX35_9BURK|nr:hypothetical protein [Roseateles terrae]MBB3196668.1 DNA-binding transcriptional MerR regulator [Roseateles terrae]OWQ84915.1 hypothetical protein CDN98_17835 [Roseateles terrae]
MDKALAPFSKSQAVHMAGIPEQVIDSLLDTDLLDSSAGNRFTFQDLVLLHAARRLQDQGVASDRIIAALANVRRSLVPAAYQDSLRFKGSAKPH